jgi:hypothetical protein
MTAAFMGAAYANGVVFFSSVLLGRRWHRIAAPHAGVFVFSLLLLIATFLHWARFNHAHPVFWAWIFIYAAAPLLVPIAFARNRGQHSGAPETRDALVPRWVRSGWAILGAGFLAVSLWGFVQPERIVAIWPWKLTPLTARVVASFYAILGAAPLSVVLERRWSAWRVGAIGMLLWHALLLIAAARRAGDFNVPVPANAWFAIECGLVVATAGTLLAMEARVARAGRS